jgi:hypothetical protein
VGETFLPVPVLDVRQETGQAGGVFRRGLLRFPAPPALLTIVALGIAAGPLGCADKGAPEQVADGFAEAYFREMNQEKAKEYTALGASAMLDAELRDVAQVRKEGYNPSEAQADVTIRRGEPTHRDQRIRFPYEIVVKADGVERTQDADIELSQIQGQWKVVRIGFHSR